MKVIEVDKVMPLLNSLDNSIQALKAWIQANQRDEGVVPPPVTCPPGQHWDVTLQKCMVDVPIPPIPPVGELGSRTNPIKLNKLTSKLPSGPGYTFSPDGTGAYSSLTRAGVKVYFEVDPISIDGRSAKQFQYTVKGYNNSKLRFYRVVCPKGGVIPAEDTRIYSNYSMSETVISADIDQNRYIYCVESRGDSTSPAPEIYVGIVFK